MTDDIHTLTVCTSVFSATLSVDVFAQWLNHSTVFSAIYAATRMLFAEYMQLNARTFNEGYIRLAIVIVHYC